MPRTRKLVVMIKEPRAGRVKTRLGQDIGMTSAAWWFRHQSRALLRRLRDPRWELVLAVAPDTAIFSRAFPVDLHRVPQGPGNLGDRMARVFHAFPPGPVCVIGADIPGITRAHIERAFQALGNSDAVFGPAPDGGYWLVGMRRGPVPAGILQNVRWSSESARADSIASMGDLRIAQVDVLRDVDTAADLLAISGDAPDPA